jgi:leader peptidase (prepilin peptidase)/N-methyltransferase
MYAISVPLTAVATLAVLTAAAAIIDMQRMYIPDLVNLAILVCGGAASAMFSVVAPVSALAGAVFGGALLWAVRFGFRRYRGYDGLGFGDVKFVAASSMWTGIEGVAPALVIACVVALGYVSIRCVATHDFDSTQPMPFGPALGLGFFAVAAAQIISGQPLVDLLIPA